MEKNRNLSAALDKMELQGKILEEKNQKLKKFKKMFKSCQALQCLHCNKSISSSIFNQHVQTCEE